MATTDTPVTRQPVCGPSPGRPAPGRSRTRLGGLLAGLVAVTLWTGCEAGREAGETTGDPGEAPGQMSDAEAQATFDGDSARLLAERLKDAMGGQDAWEETRYLRFRWIVEREGQRVADRLHAWDRHEGRYRVEFDREGARHVAIFDLDEIRTDAAIGKVPAEGEAWIDGRRLEGAARDSALHGAYGAFVNDSYWFLMPWKWTDPGVHLAYEGRRELTLPPTGGAAPDGGAGAGEGAPAGTETTGAETGTEARARTFEVVHLTFEPDLGMTNDEYWGFVDPETGLMHAWQYHLQGREERGEVIWWRDWREVGPIRLSARRVWPDGVSRIYFEDLAAGPEVPPDAFAPPAGASSGGAIR